MTPPRPEPRTLLCRWSSANPQSAVPILGRALTVTRPGVSQGRRAVQIRSFRMPAPVKTGQAAAQGQGQGQGRNMYVVRTLETEGEKVVVVVEDPSAASRSQKEGKGKGKAENGDDDDDEVMIVDPTPSTAASGHQHAHGRWTCSTLTLPSSATSLSPGPSPIFDTFIQRALFAPPQPGSAPNQQQQRAAAGYWQPRGAAVSVEGFTFSVGSGPAGTVAPPGVVGDWEVKVGSVLIKGGTSAGTAKGCIVEVTYLPVPYLPSSSTFVKDFLLSLFPPAAVQNGEIEILTVPEEALVDAGLVAAKEERGEGEEEGEWEWREGHSTFAYVHQFKKEGLL